jgi:glyceraldehyde-3-phosphate dehydrogenase/erythrose-4-phosphate dehydrogenase
LAAYLMAPGSEYVNGETIVIDGALYLATGGNFAKLTKWTDEDWHRTRQLIDQRNAADKAQRTT